MDSWWQLGEGSGYAGHALALHRITCPFCEEPVLRFGRGGHVKLAIRTRTPIVPVAILGAEEAHPRGGEIVDQALHVLIDFNGVQQVGVAFGERVELRDVAAPYAVEVRLPVVRGRALLDLMKDLAPARQILSSRENRNP